MADGLVGSVGPESAFLAGFPGCQCRLAADYTRSSEAGECSIFSICLFLHD